MSSQTKENYLKAIYHLHQKDKDISISAIGNQLGVSKPTANNMIKKLEANGLVAYERYKPIRITHEGEKAAAKVVRRHRLSEMFLTQIMHFGWEEVHEIAEELEHISTDKFFDRMDEMLGYPTIDPHGSPIPNKQGNFIKKEYIPLSDAIPGETYEVKALNSTKNDFLMLLNDKNIRLGTIITVDKIESYDQTMLVSYQNQTQVTLSATMCALLFVQKIEDVA